ncbi:MAG: hypothetical protein PVS2B2_28450 [Candidatus Acidiferrum sp.]
MRFCFGRRKRIEILHAPCRNKTFREYTRNVAHNMEGFWIGLAVRQRYSTQNFDRGRLIQMFAADALPREREAQLHAIARLERF